MTGLRVRTGCITCKTRKIKCDERKPTCFRCDSTGRTCEGYVNPPSRKRATKFVLDHRSRSLVKRPPTPKLNVSSDMALNHAMSVEERRWINYFQHGPISFFTDDYDTDVWRKLIPQLCHLEPAVLYAVVAVGASHSRLKAVSGQGHPKIAATTFELEHYNQAIRALGRRISGEASQVDNITMVCCLLFACLECIYTNSDRVTVHLHQGRSILRAMKMAPEFISVAQILQRLITQSALFGLRLNDLTQLDQTMESRLAALRQEGFSHMFEARNILEFLVHVSVRIVQTSRDLHEQGMEAGHIVGVDGYSIRLHAEMLAWKASFCALVQKTQGVQDMIRDADLLDMGALKLLVRFTSSLVWLRSTTGTGECVYDHYLDDFHDIVVWCRIILARQGSYISGSGAGVVDCAPVESGFELEQSVSSALYLTATKCRDPEIRRSAVQLLNDMRHRQFLWDPKVHSRVAMRVIEIEEGRTFCWDDDCSATASHVRPVDECARVRNSQITIMHPEAPSPLIHVVFSMSSAEGWRYGNRWSETLQLIPEPLVSGLATSP